MVYLLEEANYDCVSFEYRRGVINYVLLTGCNVPVLWVNSNAGIIEIPAVNVYIVPS